MIERYRWTELNGCSHIPENKGGDIGMSLPEKFFGDVQNKNFLQI